MNSVIISSQITFLFLFTDGFFSELHTNAGFVTRINQKGLDLLADYLGERVNRFMNHGEIFFNFSGPLSNAVSFGFLPSRITFFDAPAFKSKIISVPGQHLIWMGSHLTTSIESIFKVTSTGVEVFGNSKLNINGATIQMHLTTGINGDAHLKTDLVACAVSPGLVTMNFTEADALVLANYLGYVNNFAHERIQEIFCSSFEAQLVPVISNRLMNSPMSAALFDQYFLNYGLTEEPRYTDNAVELYHRGNAFGILRQGRNRLNDFRLPFRSASLRVPSEQHGMVDFYASNYTLSSLLFWMDQYRKFDFEISKESVNNSALAGYLKTECNAEDVCAGTLFPALAARFPNGVVHIKTHTATYPHVRIEEGKALVLIESRVDALVQQSDRSRRFLTASMSVELILKKVIFKNYALIAEMRIDKFHIYDVVSLVDGIDATSLEFLVSALNELIIGDDIAKLLQDGIKLPIVFDFIQRSSEVVFEKDRIRISADYCFDENCNDFAENKDEIDYYDNIRS
uniref:BPI2 domain-containing protein n=1 Tax=Ascaris lumbricoides TaxID=6252 RepID=A0A0M3I1K9_ASCLU